MRTSYSALSTFKKCPQRYKFREIDKIKEPKTKEQVFGSLIHNCLRFMFTHEPLFPTLDQVIEYFKIHFPEDGWQQGEAEIYREHGEKMLRNFYLKNQPWNFVVVDLESRFEIVLEDKERASSHILAGIIDRIDKLPDGSYEIIDYKTQKRMPPQADVEKDLQLSIYAMGLVKRWPHLEPRQIKLSLQFLKHDEKLSTRRTAEDFPKTEAEVIDTIRDIQGRVADKRPFEPVVSPLCDFCGYKPICPAWKHLYKNVKTEEIDGAKIPDVVKEFFQLREEKKKIEARLSELGALLTRYLAQEEIDRVFSETGTIAKSVIDKYKYDFDKLRAILEPLGKWQEILSADEAKLKKILSEIPQWARDEIKQARELVRSSTVLRATKSHRGDKK